MRRRIHFSCARVIAQAVNGFFGRECWENASRHALVTWPR